MMLPRRPVLLFCLSVLAACDLTSTEPDPDSIEALFGIWQYTIPDEMETTMRFSEDGTLEVLVADFGVTRCEELTGTWQAADGSITYSVAQVNGSETESGTVSYSISGSDLTLEWVDEDPEVLTRIEGPMPVCADYGWPTHQVFAVTIDDVDFDLTNPGPDPLLGLEISLSEIVASGSMTLGGEDGGGGTCATCRTVSLFFGTPGGTALGVGTYHSDTAGAEIAYLCCPPDPTDSSGLHNGRTPFSSNDYGVADDDPPGWASVTITLLEQYRIEGTFEGLLWNVGPGGLTSTSVTMSGRFEIWYD